ncbi:hypothetical protein EJ04DRAFT_513243 [Polyplosphaeria fusca]|uniref:Uncharacterized protein n=1 Tax=Polyplosphaeria fusca TaxID=682080 RepID=A0A9P4QXK0_9PLEO|nr:hypothetical protein EJ04DRAFT_513243 [Polyplosphaeria fusca]
MAHASRDVLPKPNPISRSVAGDSETGLGCFPLGTDVARSDYYDVLSTLRALRRRKMLSPLSREAWDEVREALAPLEEAQAFWARHRRDTWQALALHELLTILFEELGDEREIQGRRSSTASAHNLEIWLFADSKRLTSAQVQVWGLFELDTDEQTTHLYISSRTAVYIPHITLHTFFSSRQCNRTQCFLAEYILADQTGCLTDEWELPQRLQNDIDTLEMEDVRAFLGRLDTESNLEAPILQAKLAGYCEDRIKRLMHPLWRTDDDRRANG